MIRTFLDSGVLLTAARAVSPNRERALQVLEDANRVFVTSPFVYLELVPKAAYHKNRLEKAFYDEYFRAAESIQDLNQVVTVAQAEAANSGLAAMDALHIAAAHLAGAEEFVTTGRPGRPIYHSSLIQVVYLFK